VEEKDVKNKSQPKDQERREFIKKSTLVAPLPKSAVKPPKNQFRRVTS
jgi:hypothetical protein